MIVGFFGVNTDTSTSQVRLFVGRLDACPVVVDVDAMLLANRRYLSIATDLLGSDLLGGVTERMYSKATWQNQRGRGEWTRASVRLEAYRRPVDHGARFQPVLARPSTTRSSYYRWTTCTSSQGCKPLGGLSCGHARCNFCVSVQVSGNEALNHRRGLQLVSHTQYCARPWS